MPLILTVSQKSDPQKAINNILACAKPFEAKFCPVIENLYSHSVMCIPNLESLR